MTSNAEKVLEFAKKTSNDFAETLEGDDDWSPTLFVMLDNKTMGIAVFDGSFLNNKDEFATSVIPSMAHKIAKEGDARLEAILLLCSSWMLQHVPEKEFPTVAPSEHPDRVEALTLFCCSRDEELAAIGKITREDNKVFLDWDEFPVTSELAGRMIGGVRRAIWDA